MMQRSIFIDENAKLWLSVMEALKVTKPLPKELNEKVDDLIKSMNDYVYSDFYDYFKDYDIDDITYQEIVTYSKTKF